MDIEYELERLSKPSVTGFARLPLQQLAINEDACLRLAEYFDCETGGEVSPTRYVQQVLLEVQQQLLIDNAERRLERIKRGG